MKWLRGLLIRHINWLTGMVECARLVVKMEHLLYGSGAPNFMSAYTRTASGEKFEVTLRRVEGKAVSEVLNEVRAENAELRDELERLKAKYEAKR